MLFSEIIINKLPKRINVFALAFSSILLVACGSDSQDADLQSQNQSPVASAGDSIEAIEFTSVTLDGSSSSDPDGSIKSYNWKQIDNGAPIVALTNASSGIASFSLPALANDVDFVFSLSVTDNQGKSAQDGVTITGRPTPEIKIGEVTGNTAKLNSAAEFSVQLASRPSSDVRIPLSSSDPSEGEVKQSQLTFTSENWEQPQTVVVRGTNPNVVNGAQNYKIAIEPAISADALYNGIDSADVDMKGVYLEISAPKVLSQFITGVASTFQPQIAYTGDKRLSFSLTKSPAGMSIDLTTGRITWMPQPSDKGQTHSVTVAANDGSLFKSTEFQVEVAAPIAVATEVNGNTLSVIDDSTSLNGMTITVQNETTRNAATGDSSDLMQLGIEKLAIDSVPEIPKWTTPLTDVFVIPGSIKGNLELRFPIVNRPENAPLGDIMLFAYTDTAHVEGKFWSPVSINTRYEGTSDSPIIVVELGGLQGMAFFGYQTPTISPQNLQQQAKAFPKTVSTDPISCEQQIYVREAQDLYVCTSSQVEGVSVTIKGFGEGTRWGGASKEDMFLWLVDAQQWFANNSIGFDKKFSVHVHDLSHIGEGVLGYVTTGNFEQRKVLHLSNNNSFTLPKMKGTTVHEYFHHAQGHSDTRLPNKDLAIDYGSKSHWLTEGTARWFEDEVYDELNTYNLKEYRGYEILEAGLNAFPGDEKKRAYQRFSFFKFLATSCPGFTNDFKTVLNAEQTTDPTSLKNLSGNFANWSCNFGDHLGFENASTLAASMAYYNYATQYANDMSLLDANETKRNFFKTSSYEFEYWFSSMADWLNAAKGTVHKLNGVNHIPAAGAYSFRVPSVVGELPDGKIAELVVESSREVIVSVTSEDSKFIGTNTIRNHKHSWFSTLNQSSYVYAANSTVPELFVTVVNADLDNSADVKIYFRVRDEFSLNTQITSHTTGDQTSNRVITIAGEISGATSQSVSKVTVTSNGIATDTTLNADGSFSADVVVSLGDNIIKAQGFNNTSAVTEEHIIKIQGVKSSTPAINALIASRAVFVLRWNTNGTDIDIYSTDKNNGTIWYSHRTEGFGNLDHDDTNGYGPEVVSYSDQDDDIYKNGQFNIDVHYYRGAPPTNYTIDVVLNETDGSHRRSYKYKSVASLDRAASSEAGPNGAGSSRFNDILTVSCNAEQLCSMGAIDVSKLVQVGSSSAESVTSVLSNTKDTTSNQHQSSYAQCMTEYEQATTKAGFTNWSCNKDGTKLWH